MRPFLILNTFLFLILIVLSCTLVSADDTLQKTEDEEKEISISSLWDLTLEVCGLTIILVIALAIGYQMSQMKPYILKDGVTGVLSHHEDEGEGTILMILSVIIYCVAIPGMIESKLGIAYFTTVKIFGTLLIGLGLLAWYVNSKK